MKKLVFAFALMFGMVAVSCGNNCSCGNGCSCEDSCSCTVDSVEAPVDSTVAVDTVAVDSIL